MTVAPSGESPMSMTEDFASGKRRYPRILLPKGMLVAWYGGGQQEISRVGTLGMGGIFICVPNPVPVGTKLRITFEVPGGAVRPEAIVRNIVPGEGMGLEFVKLNPKDRVLLQRLLKRLLR